MIEQNGLALAAADNQAASAVMERLERLGFAVAFPVWRHEYPTDLVAMEVSSARRVGGGLGRMSKLIVGGDIRGRSGLS